MTTDFLHNFEKRYQALNDEQKRAVDTIDGPVLVVAGPGSGKTELLSLRVCNILKNTDTPPSSILCLTFTDAAAANMKKRLAGLIGQEAYKVAIHTFHSFGANIINQNPEYFYQGALYNNADELAQTEIIEDILKNLNHNFKLRSFHPDQGYTYLKDILSKIGNMKNGGLTPSDFREILNENKSFLDEVGKLLPQVFGEKISKKTILEIPALIEGIKAINFTSRTSVLPYLSMKEVFTDSLQKAYEMAEEGEKPSTKPITEWKNSFTKKNDKKEIVPADLDKLGKQFELCDVYEKYQQALLEKGLYDFNDMLLDSARTMKKYPELKYNLQERYLYVLVDEFQDTNGVQMEILDQILDSDVNEGRPNILAVGDDDQAIFKFQGANIANIMGFHGKYREPTVIVLQKNYRSTKPILDYARRIILTGNDRLEKRLPDLINKELISANENLVNGEILEKEFPTYFHELVWVAESIKEKLADGKTLPSEIAVIAPKHRILEEAAKVLDYFGITVAYERQRDLLTQTHIIELITILKFINTIAIKGQPAADEYLPEILGFPFWEINSIDVWKVSVNAYRNRKTWLEIMLAGENEKLSGIAEFLIHLGVEAKEKTAEEIIDMITGSPYKKYYFSDEKLENSRQDYLDRLQSLRAFVEKIRGYNVGKGVLTVAAAVDFLELHERHKLHLNYKNIFNDETKAVNLLTAHKAKGSEFENVYILNCQEEEWMKGRLMDKLSFPCNVPLAPESENEEDNLRLFYVSMTRAKRNLYLTRHKYTDKGDERIRLRYLENADADSVAGAAGGASENSYNSESDSSAKVKKQNIAIERVEEMHNALAAEKNLQKLLELKFAVDKHEVRNTDHNELLKGLLKDYKLNVTHLMNFLNVVDGGPQKFIEQNMLRFPQKMLPSGCFGSAMHEALNSLSVKFKADKTIPSLDYLLDRFEKSLTNQRLNKEDYKLYLAKGTDALKVYYDKRIKSFNVSDQSEFNFRGQGVVVETAALNGKLDKMVYDEEKKEIEVYDYKTGKSLKDFEHGADYEKIKGWKFVTQIIFYKLLVENARDFKGKYKVKTGYVEFLEPVDGDIKILRLDISEEETAKMKKLVRVVYQKIMNLDFPDISRYDKSVEGIKAFTDDLIAAA